MTAFLFDKKETQFTNLGLGELPITKGEVTRERNGSFTLYAELPFGATLADKIEKEMRIKADAGAQTKWQTFVINRTVKDTEHEVIKVYAEHITMMTMTDSLKPQAVAKDMDAQHALMVWNQNRLSDVQYDVGSDILTKGSTTWDVSKISNAREALGGKEGSILDVWGGEYEFDNNRIFLHKEMGRDTPTILEYGRNIQAMEYEELLDGVYTSVYPFAKYTENNEKDGSTNSKEIMVTLPEYYIDSPNAENYQNRRFQIVDFSSEFDTSGEHPEIPTPEKLRKLANSFIKNNDVGAPKIKQEVKYIDLAKTLDYEDMQFIEEIELCDRVPVFYPQLNVQANNVKVTETVFDIVNDQYETITVSTIGAVKSPSITSKLEQKLDNLSKNQSKVNKDIYYTMNQAGNRIWWVKPDDNIEHKIGDTYFEKNGKYNRIYRWDGENWILEYDSETFEKELSAKIAEADNKANNALEKIDVNTNLISEHKKTLDDINNTLLPDLSESISGAYGYVDTRFSDVLQTVNGANQNVLNDLTEVIFLTESALEKAQANEGKLTTVEETVDDLKGEISRKVTSAEVTESLSTFNETVKKQTASQITESLTGYAKSGDLTTIAQNIRTETAESLKSVYTKTETDGLLGGMSEKINSVQKTADGNEALIAKIQETPETYLADYQKLINRADLFERTLGTTDSAVGENVSRMVQTSGVIQTEVAKMDLATNTVLTSKISQLADNINLKVSSDDLLSQINVQAGGVLITSGTNKLNITPETTYIEDATIKSAMIESIEADKITTGTLDAGNVRVINIDANNITANKTSFVQSVWNSIESSIRIYSGGLLSTASDGSQVYLQNGILGVRRPPSEGGGTIGQIGYVYDGGSPTYTIQTSWGSNFAIKQTFYDSYTKSTKNKNALSMYTTDDGYSETTFRMSRINILGDAHLSFLFRHSINGSDNNRLTVNGAESVALRARDSTIFAVSNNGSKNFASLHANLNMQGNTVTNTSDIRLKRDVVNDEIDSLSALMKWQHAGYNYINPDMSQDRQFSVIAQSAPDLAFAGEDGYLQVSLNKQVNMTSHALQQHVIKTNDEITRLKEQIANLQDELALLKGA